MLFAILSALALLIFVEGVHVYDNRIQNQRTNEFIEGFASFFGDKDEAGFTNFDKTFHNFAEQIGKAQAMTTVAAMRGTVSGAVRTAENAFEEEAFQENPMQAAIVKALPKKLATNPVAQLGVEAFFNKMLNNAGKSTRPRDGNGTNIASPKFKF